MKTDKVQIQNFYNLEIVWVVFTISFQLNFFFFFVWLDIGIFLNDAYNIDSNFYANFYSATTQTGYLIHCPFYLYMANVVLNTWTRSNI